MAYSRQRAEELFEAALDRTPQDRHAFLDEVCRHTPELKQRVEELLQDDERAGTFLERPLFHFHGNTSADSASTAKISLTVNACQQGFGAMSPSRFKPGDTLGDRFVIVRFIARGGMGEVYEVEDRHLQGVHVALKMILPQFATDRATQHRFEQEVLLARKVTHPALCPIYDICHCEEPAPPFSFLTMKLLPGETLAARLHRTTALPREEAISVFKQMTAGLAAIHTAGVIHRDIKPNNVMLDGDGPDLCVWITDFGLARLHESEATLLQTGMIAGTRGYLAPELLLGQPPSQATDLFAFGVVLHEIFTGEMPGVATGSYTAVPSPRLKLADAPPDLLHHVAEFLADEPDRRCLAFEQARRLFDSNGTLAPTACAPPTLWTRRRFAFAAAATTCAVAGGVGWKRQQISDLMHPLPQKRFVALLNWPSSDARIKPMLSGVIDAIAGELARAEAFDRDLFVISHHVSQDSTSPSQLIDLRDSLGTNLILAASGFPRSDQLHLSLRVLDSTSSRPLREKQIRWPLDQPISLPDRAVKAAAELLNVGRYTGSKHRAIPDTQSPEAYAAFQAAQSLRKQDNDTGLEAAIDKYKQAIVLDPRFATAYAKLSMAYLRFYALHSDPAGLALSHSNCDTALSLNPNSVDAHIARSFVFEVAGDIQGAFREIARALAIDPSNPQTLVNQGQLYTRLNRWSEAEDSFARLLRMRPNLWLAHDELGVAYNAQGKYPQALVEFRAASLAAPRNALSLNNLAAVYLQQGRVAESKESARKSLALNPNDSAATTMNQALRSEGNYADAVQFGLKAVAWNPAEAINWLELADSYSLARGHRREAFKAYAQAAAAQEEQLRAEPADGAGLLLLAICRVKLETPELAHALLKKANAQPIGDIDSQLCKARLLELLGRRDEALAIVTACLKRGATSFQIQTMPDMGSLCEDPRFKNAAIADAPATETNL